MQQISEKIDADISTGPIRYRTKLRELLDTKPAIRRWYVSRMHPSSDQDSELSFDLLYAPCTDALTDHLGVTLENATLADLERKIREQDTDRLEWWELEDFDHRVHLTETDVRKAFLYPEGCIEEGMVFIEIAHTKNTRFIPFTYQARSESKRVFQNLLIGRDTASEVSK